MWRKQASMPREGEERKAELEKLKEETKKDMLEMVKMALSAKAAASPAASAAPGDGGASVQFKFVAERMAGLEAVVEALKKTNRELQKLYHDSFSKGKESESEISKLKKTIEEMQNQWKSVPPSTSPFNTPVQVPAWIPVSPLVVGGLLCWLLCLCRGWCGCHQAGTKATGAGR